MKKAIRCILLILLIAVLAVGAYAAYVFIDYHRIGDQQSLSVTGSAAEKPEAGTRYTIVSYNIGFGAYTPDFGFFMDGGTESRAASKESVEADLASIADFLARQEADFLLTQEVDFDATRSYHVDEFALLTARLTDYASVEAVNYDSPYLFYPILEPHGKTNAGLVTFSRFGIESAVRRSLPIESGVMKLVDLDRCYSVSRIPVENGRELVLFHTHLSAYTSDGSIAEEQIRMLAADMQAEYEQGNYVICGGDFNKDLIPGGSSAVYGVSGAEYTWAQPFPTALLRDTALTLAAPCDAAEQPCRQSRTEGGDAVLIPQEQISPTPSCRNADGPYHEGQFVLNIDGFIVSDNVTVETTQVLDTGFAWSDHNPVRMTFILE